MDIHLKRLFLLIPCDRDLSELPSEHLAALRPIPYTHRNNPKESKAASLAKRGTKPGGFPWMSPFQAVQTQMKASPPPSLCPTRQTCCQLSRTASPRCHCLLAPRHQPWCTRSLSWPLAAPHQLFLGSKEVPGG